jgi:hypothetical protein
VSVGAGLTMLSGPLVLLGRGEKRALIGAA